MATVRVHEPTVVFFTSHRIELHNHMALALVQHQASDVLDMAMLGIPTYDELIRMQDVPIAPQLSLAVGRHVASARPMAPPSPAGKRAKRNLPIAKAPKRMTKKAAQAMISNSEQERAVDQEHVTRVFAEPAATAVRDRERLASKKNSVCLLMLV